MIKVEKISVKMGSYIGVSRLVGAIENIGIMKWPKPISPFDVVIIPVIKKTQKITKI